MNPHVHWELDYANLMAPRLGGAGLTDSDLDGGLTERFAAAHAKVQQWYEDGRLGFIDLPSSAGADACSRVAARLPEDMTDVLVLGIGGSALGTRTVRDALAGVRWNEESAERRGGRPRLHVLDNPDPALYRAVVGGVDPATTVVNVVSKSGGTSETLALYQAVRAWMESGGVDVAPRMVFTTDPERGPLRAIAAAEGFATLDVPPNVGGRFSVLSPVGLFPATVLGLDAQGLLDGAAAIEAQARQSELRANAPGLFATALHTLHEGHGFPIHVLMPYRSGLATLALWFQQLWAESLGKVRADGVHVGPTPLPGVGASDQHAQVQLFMEGPADKVVCFVSAPDPEDVLIPGMHPDHPALDLLAGHGLGALLDIEREATAEALRQAGRPNMTLHLGRVDAVHLGALFHFFQRATVFAGALYEVDPLDQPGVELGKQLTRARLADSAVPESRAEPSARWRVEGGATGS